MFDDDIAETIRYALQPTFLLLYALVFVGEWFRGVYFGRLPFGGLLEPLEGVVRFLLGIVSFGFEVVGFLFVAVGVVAVLRIVARDATGGGSPGSAGIAGTETVTTDGPAGDDPTDDDPTGGDGSPTPAGDD